MQVQCRISDVGAIAARKGAMVVAVTTMQMCLDGKANMSSSRSRIIVA